MPTKYVHTNIVAKDWRKLAQFYKDVLDCKPILPERNLSGKWIDKATNLYDVQIRGTHMRLPGYDENGPTLEIFEYNEMPEHSKISPNTPGFSHISFAVDNVGLIAQKAFDHGATKVGELTIKEIPNVGVVTFWYIKDPEGNIIELQSWTSNNSSS